MISKILIADNDKEIVDMLYNNLKREGYEVVTAYNGYDAIKKTVEERPDLILMEINLPVVDGFKVCKSIRAKTMAPIIVISEKNDEVDKVLAFELGVDDYVTKPFSARELLARIKANIRRYRISSIPVNSDIVKIGDLEIDLLKYEVIKNGQVLDLTTREFELLKFLLNNKNKIFSREALLEKVWGYKYYGDIRTVDVTVRRLREKVEDDPANAKYICTKRGVGYFFNDRNN